MPNNPLDLILSLRKKFLIKKHVYGLVFWIFSVGLVVTAAIISLLSALVSSKVITIANNYTLSVLIVSAFSSLLTSALTFFLFRKKWKTNAALLTFIDLEMIIYQNRIGIYGQTQQPEILFLDRLYEKLGVNPIVKVHKDILPHE